MLRRFQNVITGCLLCHIEIPNCQLPPQNNHFILDNVFWGFCERTNQADFPSSNYNNKISELFALSLHVQSNKLQLLVPSITMGQGRHTL